MVNAALVSARARVSALRRHRDEDDHELREAVRDLVAANLAESVREAINGDLPITRAQRRRIARMLTAPDLPPPADPPPMTHQRGSALLGAFRR